MVVDPPTAFRGALLIWSACTYGSSIIRHYPKEILVVLVKMKTHWEIRLSLLHSCVMIEYNVTHEYRIVSIN